MLDWVPLFCRSQQRLSLLQTVLNLTLASQRNSGESNPSATDRHRRWDPHRFDPRWSRADASFLEFE
jgi:hypothetical protein